MPAAAELFAAPFIVIAGPGAFIRSLMFGPGASAHERAVAALRRALTDRRQMHAIGRAFPRSVRPGQMVVCNRAVRQAIVAVRAAA